MHSFQNFIVRLIPNHPPPLETRIWKLVVRALMVNHQLLLNKLRAFGVGKRSEEWFQSYLINRYQFVSVNGVSSEKLCLQSEVPQGSVLGHLMFTIFINDLPQMVQDSVVDMFADDTTLSHASHFTNVNATHCALQTSADNLVKWSDDNFMVLNSTKTKSNLITGKRLKNLPVIISR